VAIVVCGLVIVICVIIAYKCFKTALHNRQNPRQELTETPMIPLPAVAFTQRYYDDSVYNANKRENPANKSQTSSNNNTYADIQNSPAAGGGGGGAVGGFASGDDYSVEPFAMYEAPSDNQGRPSKSPSSYETLK